MHQWRELFSGIPSIESERFSEVLSFCSCHTEQLLASLPWSAAELAGNDGFENMFRFIEFWGGSRFYVPRDHKDFAIKAAIPLSSATHRQFLKNANAASVIDVPSAWGIFLVMRRTAILAALEQGAARSMVAHDFGVTERALRKLITKVRPH